MKRRCGVILRNTCFARPAGCLKIQLRVVRTKITRNGLQLFDVVVAEESYDAPAKRTRLLIQCQEYAKNRLRRIRRGADADVNIVASTIIAKVA